MINYIFYSLNAFVYKKQPTARIYINNNLADEHEIEHVDVAHVEDLTKISMENHFRVIKFDTNSNSLDIKIQILNQDNNYSNGFMTKTTQVNLRGLYVLTQKALDKIPYILKNYKWQRKTIDTSVKSILRYYKSKMLIRDFVESNLQADFPNMSYKHNVSNRDTVGGNGSYQIKLLKKLGFWRRGEYINHGIHRTGEIYVAQSLWNKYNYYENQRNNN